MLKKSVNVFLVTLAFYSGLVFNQTIQARDFNDLTKIESASCNLDSSEIKQICETAREITVRIFSDNDFKKNRGSGTIIERAETKDKDKKLIYLYLVLTNDHVVQNFKNNKEISPENYRLETSDGYIHHFFVHKDINFKGNDLALLWFASYKYYKILGKGDLGQLNDKEKLFVSGFPVEYESQDNNFQFTEGIAFVELIKTKKSLVDGYQLGFDNDTKNGMSGGSILNEKGFLVGINGRGKYQDFGFRSADPDISDNNPYLYQDGTLPKEATIQRFKQLAWGIPIENYTKNLSKDPFYLLKIPQKIKIDQQPKASKESNLQLQNSGEKIEIKNIWEGIKTFLIFLMLLLTSILLICLIILSILLIVLLQKSIFLLDKFNNPKNNPKNNSK